MSMIKKDIVSALATAANEKEFNGTNVILYTSAGTIYGKMVMDGVAFVQSEKDSLVTSFYSDLLNAVNQKAGCDSPNENNAYIHLTDAFIKTSLGAPTRVGNIVVFYDQIAAINIGTVETRKLG